MAISAADACFLDVVDTAAGFTDAAEVSIGAGDEADETGTAESKASDSWEESMRSMCATARLVDCRLSIGECSASAP